MVNKIQFTDLSIHRLVVFKSFHDLKTNIKSARYGYVAALIK